MELDRTERRILGSLVEKRLSTPDQYPLSLNALLAAVNQKSNRDPVFDLKEFEVTGALMALRERGLILIREREGGRVKRYAERLSEELRVDDRAAAILAELMLRGDQTVGELLRRIPRMSSTESQGQVEQALSDLASARLVRLNPRAAGRRHPRWSHLLAPDSEAAGAEAGTEPAEAPPPTSPAPLAPERDPVDELREEILDLRREVADLTARVRRIEDSGGGDLHVGE